MQQKRGAVQEGEEGITHQALIREIDNKTEAKFEEGVQVCRRGSRGYTGARGKAE